MKIVELNNAQFDEYAKYHPLNNYCQSSKYALIMSEYGYSYDYLGLIDDESNIKAASLILTKRMAGKVKYGYAPKGFLINYYDTNLIREFLNGVKDFYSKDEFVFIKFNPEIIIGETDARRKYQVSYNGNVRIIDELKAENVKRRMELKEFELLQPKFNAYVNMKTFDLNKLCRNYRKKIKKAINYGMSLEIGTAKEIDVLYSLLKNKTNRPLNYFRNMYNVYNRDNMIDLVFVKIDIQQYLTSVKESFETEQQKNDAFNEIIQNIPKKKNLNRKMDSDKKIESLKSEIIRATQVLKKHQSAIIAGALIIKHSNRITLITSGYSDEFKYLNPNHYLYYAIIEKYKEYYNYFDLGGVTGNFSKTSPYHGINDFKLKFNPTIYEFVGEFDLICDDKVFKKLIKTSFIEDEFIKDN